MNAFVIKRSAPLSKDTRERLYCIICRDVEMAEERRPGAVRDFYGAALEISNQIKCQPTDLACVSLAYTYWFRANTKPL